MEANKLISILKIVPVVVLHDENNAVPLAEALVNGGLPVAEITFRTDAASASIKRMTNAYPDMLVGAGTITTVEQAKDALEAGAKFLVSPGFDRAVVEYAISNSVAIYPGACTPTELMLLMEYNLDVAKFFPASQFGGLATIKALSAPFPQMKFMPTGGINLENIEEFLLNPSIIACGGSWMVKDTFIKEGNFKQIQKLTEEAVDIVKNISKR